MALLLNEGWFHKKKDATEDDIDNILGLKPDQADLNSLYKAPSYESYILNFKSLPHKEVIKLFREIEDEVAFMKYLDMKKARIEDEDSILMAFILSRTTKELHALYEKQTMKTWQINIAIQHGIALESLYRYNKLTPGSLDKAIKRGRALNYLFRYQPAFKRKHLEMIAPFLAKHFGQSVDLDKMELYDRDETALWRMDPSYQRKVTPNTKRYLLESEAMASKIRGRVNERLEEIALGNRLHRGH